MKELVNEEGFKKAMSEKRPWTMLSCNLTETEPDSWYWEIDMAVFEGGDGEGEQCGFGDGLEPCEYVWNNMIEKYSPDEYIIERINYKK